MASSDGDTDLPEVDLFIRKFGFAPYDIALGRTTGKALIYRLAWNFRHEVVRMRKSSAPRRSSSLLNCRASAWPIGSSTTMNA